MEASELDANGVTERVGKVYKRQNEMEYTSQCDR